MSKQSLQVAESLEEHDLLESIEYEKSRLAMDGVNEEMKHTSYATKVQSLSFSQWIFHEPIAIIVLSTLVSLAIQRASARIESFAVTPVVDKLSSWLDDSKTDLHTNETAHAISGAASVTTKAPAWQIQVVALFVDLGLNFILVYLVYLLLVRGGLRPTYGTR